MALFQETSYEQTKTAAEPARPADGAEGASGESKSLIINAWRAAWPKPSSPSASSSTTAPSTADSSTTTNSASFSTPPEYDQRDRSLGEAVLPTHMSCRQAFDLAWACQSPAGQWRAVYRHGGVRPCSQLWDDFWFCMRVKRLADGGDGGDPDTPKAQAVRAHYRRKELDRYYAPGQPSSEDVWRSRTVDEVLPPGAVFTQNFQVVIADDGDKAQGQDDGARRDADNILADAERRQNIRQKMGYDN